MNIVGFLRVLRAVQRLRGCLAFFKIKSRLTTKARRGDKIRSKALLLTNIVGFLRVPRAA